MSKDSKPEVKEFGLKEIELRMVSVLQNQYFSSLSNFLSFVALERLAYPVTEQTNFEVKDGKLLIKEVVPEEPAVATDEGDTKEALKK